MRQSINIVEPTLTTEAGHCYSFVSALTLASTGDRLLRLWVNRNAELTFDATHVEMRKYFFRRLRRPQSYLLYRTLLVSSDRLFISTAGRTDLLLLDWAACSIIPLGKVYLYFHWFNPSEKKLLSLKKIATKQPNLVILGPTPSVVKVFQEAGFVDTRVVPYPISRRAVGGEIRYNIFRHLLYAGAARQDKGFKHVVDLVEQLYQHRSQIPVILQSSAEHFGKYDAETLADIERLKLIPYPYLRLRMETLTASEYADLFFGAIALQLYNTTDFSDRVSGVTLDAFSGGCPVISTSGTWIARMVERFCAGVVIEDVSPQTVLEKATDVIADYARYNANASNAGRVLQQENSADVLYKVLIE